MKVRRVSFQGELGAFSQVAARRLAGEEFVPLPLPTFQDVFQSVASGKCDAAVIPIENTLHGSIHENYDHLLRFELPIRGETFVRIVHNLIAIPGVRLADIKRIYSHPVALNQCRSFLDAHPEAERIPFYDTAGSVKMIMEAVWQAPAPSPPRPRRRSTGRRFSGNPSRMTVKIIRDFFFSNAPGGLAGRRNPPQTRNLRLPLSSP